MVLHAKQNIANIFHMSTVISGNFRAHLFSTHLLLVVFRTQEALATSKEVNGISLVVSLQQKKFCLD